MYNTEEREAWSSLYGASDQSFIAEMARLAASQLTQELAALESNEKVDRSPEGKLHNRG